MLNIAVCDDDIPTTGRLEMLIEKIAKQADRTPPSAHRLKLRR